MYSSSRSGQSPLLRSRRLDPLGQHAEALGEWVGVAVAVAMGVGALVVGAFVGVAVGLGVGAFVGVAVGLGVGAFVSIAQSPPSQVERSSQQVD